MFSTEIIERTLDEILPRVQKPGRYIGGEFNQIVKEWGAVKTRIALAFPDIYDIGVPNLGLAIFYDSINRRDDALAERTYLPWLDMEGLMRERSLPLYSLESKHALIDFDILAITLPYETLYTNTLNLLDLAGIPLESKDRSAHFPLVIAGGHAVYNPEPMAPFIDAFVIGEGEEVIDEIIAAHQAWKSSLTSEKSQLLSSLAKIPGVYVPGLYQPVYAADGRIKTIERQPETAPGRILKRMVPRLPAPPTRFIVPTVDVVHNRVAVEIMRGCTRGCRFCHAGFVTRPVRERSVEEIINAIDQALSATGFEEIALLSLSSSDYTQINDLVEAVSQRYAGRHLSISLPSLRIETTSVDLLERLRGNRSGGFTLAPEAATDRMRNTINKPIQSEQLLETARAIYSRGWPTLKLYFMIGHPSETLDDVQGIVDLCTQVMAVGKSALGRRAALNIGVSTFVPKPHTPFQWSACDTPEIIQEKQRLLRNGLRQPGIKLSWTDPKETMLEAWLSRGDRRMSAVIRRAWELGAKFDAWQDQFRYDAWIQAFQDCGLDPAFYTHRERDEGEIFPWDHIHTGVRKEYLLSEFRNSQAGVLRADCRDQCYACGILPEFSAVRRENPGPYWMCPEVAPRREKTPTP